MANMNMVQALNSAMDLMLGRDPAVVLMGEDIGYFGGVFRATEGLQRKYGEHRVIDTPIAEGGIVAPTGKAGGLLLFHGNLVHGSAGNITPYPRKIVYLTLNAISNYIRSPTRPEFIAHRDFTPIETVDDDALLRLARSHRQAAE